MNLYPYQSAGREWLRCHPAGILADEPGLGKTAQAIAAAAAARAYPALVICPAGLKRNWAREVNRWTGDTALIIDAGDPWPDPVPRWVIINYDILHRYPHMRHVPWGCNILDEAHYIKNALSSRAGLAVQAPCRNRWLLTGTPLMNTPAELWPLLASCDWDQWHDRDAYVKAYCPEFTVMVRGRRRTKYGIGDLAGLSMRAAPWILRRRKADVLPELPPKREEVITLDAPAVADLKDIDGGQMSRVRHEEGIARVRVVCDYIHYLLDGGVDKLVVWFWHFDVGQGLIQGCADIPAVLVDGNVSLQNRARYETEFQLGAAKIFFGEIQAAGQGITLTAASRAVFCESSWVPAQNTQASDRIHRIGQRDSCLIETVNVPGTLDSVVQSVCRRKLRTAGAVLGDSVAAEVAAMLKLLK